MTMSGEWWLVVRIYRNKRRVLSMHATEDEGRAAFEKQREHLRDGDVVLAHAALDTRAVCSGGYNRTRW